MCIFIIFQAKMKLGNDKEKIESIIHEVCALSFSDETLGDVGMKLSDKITHDKKPKLLNDSWVKIETDELLDISMKSEQPNDIFQTTESKKVLLMIIFFLFNSY